MELLTPSFLLLLLLTAAAAASGSGEPAHPGYTYTDEEGPSSCGVVKEEAAAAASGSEEPAHPGYTYTDEEGPSSCGVVKEEAAAAASGSEEPAHPGYTYTDEEGPSSCGVVKEEAAAAAPVPERREEFDGGRIVDISHYYREEMPAFESAEGTPGFLRLARSMRNDSDIANFSELRLTAHSGTHVDAPGHVFEHYYDAGFDVDTLDLAVLNGPAMLVDVPRDSNITADVMESLHIPKGVRRVLFRTLNTDRKLMWRKEFDPSYVGFMKDGAQWLIDNTDIQLVGVDYLSVGAYDECIPAHLVFLEKREVILVEALNLEHVTAGIYTLHCLPLRLRGAEGSPARCILIK